MSQPNGLPLGIEGRKAIVCGSSKGLGHACAEALAMAGAEVVLNGRSGDALDQARQRLSDKLGRPLLAVAADVTSEAGRALLFEACPDPDILVTNCGGPPPGHFQDWGEEQWHAALQASMITPIQLIRAAMPGMRERRWGRIVNITSTSVKTPMPLLGLSNGARNGLTGFIAGLAREVAADGVTVNNLLPGLFETDRLEAYMGALGRDRGLPMEAVKSEYQQANPTRRFGRPPEFGATCAFLCSEHAGYVTGQNWLLDGGAYPGVQ